MARACCETSHGEKDGGPKEGRPAPRTCIAGNPNAGKTTLFNLLTGARQRTGNWPGVTVERREGTYRDEEGEVRIIDLPGTYTLSPAASAPDQGLDERIARHAIAAGDCGVIIDVVDASNLERNLYLTVQIAESGRPMVVALNMMDQAEAAGLRVDAEKLAAKLGVPVVPMVARTGKGVNRLMAAVRQVARAGQRPALAPKWPKPVAALLGKLEELGVPRWQALRMLEGDAEALKEAPEKARALARERVKDIEAELGEDIDLILAEARYDLAHEIAQEVMRAPQAEPARSLSDRIDRVVLNPFAGPLIFLAAMYLLFMFTINVGGAFIDFFDILAGAIFVDGLRTVLEGVGAPAWIIALLADGIGAGVQTVATFIPIIGFLYLALSFLEDSGYLARAAFLVDRLMRAIGLPGKAFVPLIVGFGCNVPAVMAARTLENPRDRIATILMAPFMSCGARLAVFALFAAAFFPSGGQNIVFALYLIGIAAAILTGWMLRKTLLKGETMPFVMELPPYHMPRVRDMALHAWLRLKGFVFGAGRIIVVVVAVLGLVNSLGTDGTFGNQHSEKSVLSVIGKKITPVFAPIGIREENWPATVGLFTGIFAKEVVVGTLNALYAQQHAAGDDEETAFDFWGQAGAAFASIPANLKGLAETALDPLGLGAAAGSREEVATEQEVHAATFGAMARLFGGKVAAFAYMLFVLLYFPCAATFGAIAREIGLRWALFAALWSTWLGWFAAAGFYQAATFAQHPAGSALWLAGLGAGMAGVILLLRTLGNRGALKPAPAE